MAFQNIDARGNRHNRRAVAAIQRHAGAESRKAAAEARRKRKADRRLSQDLGRTIVFYTMPIDGVTLADPDGAYINPLSRGNMRQVVVAGPFRASLDHYVKAIGAFLKTDFKLVSSVELPLQEGALSDRVFTSIIVERA
jgi:hypothetical protein